MWSPEVWGCNGGGDLQPGPGQEAGHSTWGYRGKGGRLWIKDRFRPPKGRGRESEKNRSVREEIGMESLP